MLEIRTTFVDDDGDSVTVASRGDNAKYVCRDFRIGMGEYFHMDEGQPKEWLGDKCWMRNDEGTYTLVRPVSG